MSAPVPAVVSLQEGRFARLEAIAWWDQARVAGAKVLVVGAGVLGNEVIKNLALLGVGRVAIVDRDRVETSNLCRSVLFRAADEGRPKARCAARAARRIYPGLRARALVANVLADVGLGWFRWADAVVGAVDNREARLFINRACAQVGRPWFDGGIEVLQGVMRGFAPPATACYECTMGQADWDLLNQRRSCSLLARRAAAERGTPTTPTTGSIIAALQVQELIKHLHGMPALLGAGVVFDGAGHASARVGYPVSPLCPWHEAPPPIEAVPRFGSDTRLAEIWAEGERRLGGLDALDLSRELVERLECAQCRRRRLVCRPADRVTAGQLVCPGCGRESAPVFVNSISAGSPLLRRTVRGAGLPRWDVLWARRGSAAIGFELAGDAPPDGGAAAGKGSHGQA